MHTTNPSNGEGSTVRPASPLNTDKTSSLDCVGACVGEQVTSQSDAKRGTNLKARLCLLGWGGYELASGEWLVTRWGHHRTLPGIDAAEAFLRQVGGAR